MGCIRYGAAILQSDSLLAFMGRLEAWRGNVGLFLDGGFGIGSDFTWQANALAGYRFSLLGADATAAIGYRFLDQDYEGSDLDWDITLHGPVLGLGVQF